MLFIICWMRPIICCSGIYSPGLRLAPEFLFLEPKYTALFLLLGEYDDPMWMAEAVSAGDTRVIQEQFARMYRSLGAT